MNDSKVTPVEAQAVPDQPNDALMALARRCLWIAYCWNDHNFDPASKYAREEAQRCGIKSFDEANEWLTRPTPAAADLHQLARVCFEAGIARGQGAKNDWSTDGRALAIIDRLVVAASPAAAADQPQPKRGTDAQILFERELTVAAIRGAMAFGYQGVNPPPESDHWLAEFWQIGRDAASPVAPAGAPTARMLTEDELQDGWGGYDMGFAPKKLAGVIRKFCEVNGIAQGCELATAATKQQREHSVHLAMSTSSVPTAAPLLEPSATDRSELPRGAGLRDRLAITAPKAYQCRCAKCRELFIGRKRDVCCALCGEDSRRRPASSEAAPSAEGSVGNECNRSGG